MNTRRYKRHLQRYLRPRFPHRDRENGLLMGVCAGLSDYFRLQVWIVRLLSLVSLWLLTIPTALVYITIGFLLRDKPLHYYGRGSEPRFWRGGTTS